MGIADYLYNVVDAIPGERGGYADALVTLLGGDSRRQRANRNIQAAMALFGSNPSQQEIQAFAENNFQPMAPEDAGPGYQPRLNQLQQTAEQNQPMVEAARLAMQGGDTPKMSDVFQAWRLNQFARVLDDPRFTREQQAAMVTGEDISPYRAATGGQYNRYSGGFKLNPIGQSVIGQNNASAADEMASANFRNSRAQSMSGVDQARINTLGQQGQYYGAGAGLRQAQADDVTMRKQLIESYLTNPNGDPTMKLDAANRKKVGVAPQRFKIQGPDGKSVWAQGTMGADGRPIVQPMTGPDGVPLEVPPNADTQKAYEWQSVDAALAERFPHSTPQQRIAVIKGDTMASSRAFRDMQDAEEKARATAEAQFDQDTGLNNEGEDAAATAPAATSGRAVGSGSGMSANPAALKRIAEQKKQQIIKEARDQNLSEAIIQYRLRLVDEQLARMLGK